MNNFEKYINKVPTFNRLKQNTMKTSSEKISDIDPDITDSFKYDMKCDAQNSIFASRLI